MDYQGDVIWSVKLVMRVFYYVFFFNLSLLAILGHVYKFDLALFILWRECNTMEVILFYMSSHDHNPNICSSQGAEKMDEMTNVKPFAIMFLSLFFSKSTSG